MLAQGISGTIKWTLENDGTLYFVPVDGKEGTFAESAGDYFNGRSWYGYRWNKFGKYIKEIKSAGRINLAKDSSYMFYDCVALSNLEGLKNWNTQNVTRMSFMFAHCSSLTNINSLKNWDTSNVTHMNSMFYDCVALSNLEGLKNWNTQNVTRMSFMFAHCSSLTNINSLKNWDTSNVTHMNSMFYGCSSLSNCEGLKDWNTHNIEYPYFMFFDCISLTTVGVSNANKYILHYLPTNETDTLSYKYYKVGTTDYCDPYEFSYNWNSSFEGIWSREKEQNNVSQDTKKDLEVENINLSLDKKNLVVTVPTGITVTVQFK